MSFGIYLKFRGAFCVEVIFEDAFDRPGRAERAHRIDGDAAPQVPAPPQWKLALQSQRFDMLVGVLIMANAVVMCLELEYHGSKLAKRRNLSTWGTGLSWPKAEESFVIMEQIFTATFVIELLLRLLANGFCCAVGSHHSGVCL